MGVSKDAAGLPWKRETTMERGGCHPFCDERSTASGSGSSYGVRLGQLVSRRVTDENRIERIYAIDPPTSYKYHFGGVRAALPAI